MEYAKIKFSHRYYKMPVCVKNTYLLEVLTADRKDLILGFIIYDTEYPKGHYELPKGKLLVLLLLTPIKAGKENYLWTTIRRWTPEKEKYYKSLRGSQVEVVIDDR